MGARRALTSEPTVACLPVPPFPTQHPVTGEQVLFLNPNFAKQIVGLSKDESGESGSRDRGARCAPDLWHAQPHD